MKTPLIRSFLWSAGVLFLVTAVAKFVSASGNARVLQNPDPLLGIQFANVFWIVGGIETIVAVFCFFGKRPVLQTGLVAWVATNFLVYRLGLKWVGYHKPCSCLGNLTDALHISPETPDTAMKVVLGYPRTQTVGRSNVPCVETVDYGAYVTAYQAWQDCLIDANRNHPFPIQCKEPDYCDWHFCNAATTGGTPITAPVLYDIGDACGAGGVAKLWYNPSLSSFFADLLSVG